MANMKENFRFCIRFRSVSTRLNHDPFLALSHIKFEHHRLLSLGSNET